jgi:hypothetical protein
MEQGESIGRARLALNRNEDATAGRQCVENPAIVRLKPDATHRS